jgi:hypothetical protein
MSNYNAVSLLELAQRSLMLAFVHNRRVTSTNFLLHPYLRYPHSSSFSAYYAAKQFVVLHWRVRPVASVRLSLSTELCPGTRQLTYFLRLSTSDLSTCVKLYVYVVTLCLSRCIASGPKRYIYCHSPRDYAQVPDNWLIFLDYLLVI